VWEKIWGNFKEAFSENKIYFISEIALMVFTIIFISFLVRYNDSLQVFFEVHENPIERAWAIFGEEHFSTYFIIGILNLLSLSFSIVFNFKSAFSENLWLLINVVISFFLATTLLTEFWNPILTTVFLVSIAGIGLVTSN